MKNLGQLVKQAQQMQKRMQEVQEKLAEERFEASAGGGAVVVTVDGRQRLVAVKIRPEAMKDGDAELMEDLLLAATREAQGRAEEHVAKALGPLAGGLGLPF